METTAAVVATSLASSSSFSKPKWHPLCIPSLSPCRAHLAIPFSTYTPSLCLPVAARHPYVLTGRRFGWWSVATPRRAAAAENSSSDYSETWLLEPVGDGDSRHIGYRVPLPNAFEMASNAVTVGRLPGKADMVIPIATVSGVHARLEKKEGALLITDLDSTNGTYVDDQRLKPGVAATVLPGNCVTFGDTNLAIFRVSKLEDANLPREPDESENEVETEIFADLETAI